MKVHFIKFSAITIGSYIELPDDIKNKKAIVNVKNRDDYCFLWAVISALCPAKKYGDRMSSYPNFHSLLRFTDMKFPMDLKQIPSFEKLNNLRINVFGLEKIENGTHKVIPICLSKYEGTKTINLLMFESSIRTRSGKYHFAWIKNLSKLLSTQISKHHHKLYVCDHCLNHFYSASAHEQHVKDCTNGNACKMELPVEGVKYLKFQNLNYTEDLPFAIYADFNWIFDKPQTLEASSAGYYVKCTHDDSLSFYKHFRGKYCVKWFLNELHQLAENIEPVFMHNTPMDELTNDETLAHEAAKICHICEEVFNENDTKFKNYCHRSGKYKGAAHSACYMNYKTKNVIPVVFYSLSSNCANLFIQQLLEQFKGTVSLLHVHNEKYVTFKYHLEDTNLKFRFVDSFSFFKNGIETFVFSVIRDRNSLLLKECNNLEEFLLLERAELYLNNYVDSWKKLDEEQLPVSEISSQDYIHALNVWKTFKISNIGQYADLYLKRNVLLLTDIVETLRGICLKTYSLDPLYYNTASALAFDAVLRKTRVQLELLHDIDMVLFIEKGMRKGLVQCPKTHATANNKYMSNNYNPNAATSYIMYFDLCNLYEQAITSPLPFGDFKWVDASTINIENIHENEIGYILEVDLEYPSELFEHHTDLPFCPEYLQSSKKLTTTLLSKANYVIHYKYLQQCLKNGLILTKVHRVLQFRQSCWMKPYVDINNKLRDESKSDLAKDFYKLMNSAVFEMTTESLRKVPDYRLITTWKGQYGMKNWSSKTKFHNLTMLNENMAIIQLNKTIICYNKPIYLGFCVFDIAKVSMYDFHYQVIKKKFQSCAKLLYADGGSFIYHFIIRNIYPFITENLTSRDMSKDISYAISKEKEIFEQITVGENPIISEFFGLRGKMYACKSENNVAKETENVMKSQINFNDYSLCFFNEENVNNLKQYVGDIERLLSNSVTENEMVT